MTRRRWVPGLLLMAGFAGCVAKPGPPASESAEGEASVTVRAEPARKGPMAESVEALGRVEALPDHLATLTPNVEGHVESLLVRQGESVKKGQPIVEFDRSVALADLAEKTATRDGLRASLALLRSLPRPEEQKPLALAVDSARVALERADRQNAEMKKLQANKLANSLQIFDAEKGVEVARIALETAESQHRLHMIGPRPEAVAEAENKIRTADGLVAFSQAHLDFHTIRAPIDGVLDSLTCHPGQTIPVGSTIGEVVDARQVDAAGWLPPRASGGIRTGQSASVRPAEQASPGADALAGKVAFVGRVVDPQTGNLPVRVRVDNAGGRLALGETIRLVIDQEEKKDVLQVPSAAILDLGEGPILGVIRGGKSVVLHPEVGAARDGWVAVTGTDLKEGEPVIVEGGYNLPEGTAVKAAEPEKAKAVARGGDDR